MAKSRHFIKKIKIKKQAIKDIRKLFQDAKESYKKNKKKSDNLLRKARRLSLKHKVKIPVGLKRIMCKNCYKLLVPGDNCRIRVARGKVIYYCLECKRFMRFPFSKKKKKKISKIYILFILILLIRGCFNGIGIAGAK